MDRTLDPEILALWIGRTATATDILRPEPARMMQATLDRAPTLGLGDPLPPLWHWLYHLDAAPLSALGRDGHPATGGFLPPVALPRRMWAGGRLGFDAPLPLGVEVEKTSTITAVTPKQGRSGPLCFVTVRHELSTDGTRALWEEHDIVYRADPGPGDPLPEPAPFGDWPASETRHPSEVQLFRYSALTFNGHRIHYDRDYARDVEGHAGLVVHGPLIATLLADLATTQLNRPLRRFDFRATAPVTLPGDLRLGAAPERETCRLAAGTGAGALAMTATATV
ncbi:MaoC family dehydratase N-terminal domain-containing protein [Jannaschia sp. KMU-145]|uniref:FAS1-like dehydratase domain-containing protein n=1 Tax=Jannaschia halovivens TaxID=3388667 RepID=UPI00396B41A9